MCRLDRCRKCSGLMDLTWCHPKHKDKHDHWYVLLSVLQARSSINVHHFCSRFARMADATSVTSQSILEVWLTQSQIYSGNIQGPFPEKQRPYCARCLGYFRKRDEENDVHEDLQEAGQCNLDGCNVKFNAWADLIDHREKYWGHHGKYEHLDLEFILCLVSISLWDMVIMAAQAILMNAIASLGGKIHGSCWGVVTGLLTACSWFEILH